MGGLQLLLGARLGNKGRGKKIERKRRERKKRSGSPAVQGGRPSSARRPWWLGGPASPGGHRSQSRREGPRGGTKPASLSALGTAAGPGGAPTRGRGRRRRRRLGPGERKKRVRVSKEKNRLALLFLRTQRSAVGFVWTDEIKSGGGS